MNVRELKQSIVDQKLQIVEVNREGVIISSENNIIPFKKDQSIGIEHAFFVGVEAMLETLEEPLKFPCINLEVSGKSVIVDIDIIPNKETICIVIFNFTNHYNHAHPLVQEKNEAYIEKNKLFFDKQLLLAKEEFKNKFLAHLNHEIRNPLNNLMGFMEILESSNLDYDQQQTLSVMNKTGMHLKVLMDDMLDISQIERGVANVKHVNFNLHRILKNLKNHFQLKFQKNPVGLHIETNPDVPVKLIGDPIRLNQILFNLIENAYRNTVKGTIDLTISLQESNEDSKSITLLFRLEDTGHGISPERIHQIFDSYFQLEYQEMQPIGEGLGLKIVKDITTLLSGTLEVTSVPNEGTVFNIALPLEKRKTQPKRKSVPKGSGILLSKRILIIENEEISQMLFMKTFINNEKGYVIEIAQNASHAFELLERKIYHLVILKMNIPDISGLEFMEQVRAKKDSSYQDIPLLMVSGNTMKEQQQTYLNAGANEFLAKPYTQKELFNSIEKLS